MILETFLTRHPLFGVLSPALLRPLAAQAKVRSLRIGDALCHEGEPGDALYVLLGGRLDVERSGKGTVASLGRRGEIVGEVALLTGRPRTASVRAALDSSVLEIPGAAFQDLLGRAPQLGLPLSKLLSERLSGGPVGWTRPRHGYIAFLGAGEPRIEAGRAMARSLAQASGQSVLFYDLGAPEGRPGVIQTLSDVPLERQEEFVRGLGARSPSGLTELAGVIPDRMWSYFLGVFRESFHTVLFGIPYPMFRPVHPQVAQASDLYVVLCGADSPRASELETLLASAKPTVLIRARGRSRHVGLGWKATDIPVAATERQLGEPGALDPVVRKILGKSLGVALGSGAAHGYTHIGVLDVLEQEGIPVDFVAGTSMGALIGGFYAAGLSTAEMTRLARDASVVRRILPLLDLTVPRSGFLRGRKVEAYLRKHVGDVAIENLPRPYCAVATEIRSGREVVFDRGPLWEAIRASISIPCFFEPVSGPAGLLVDGGVANPVPVGNAIEMGAERTLAVNVTSGPTEGKHKAGILSIFLNSIYTLQALVSENRCALADVSLSPEFADVSWTDFHRAEEIIEIGRAATRRALPEIRRVLSPNPVI